MNNNDLQKIVVILMCFVVSSCVSLSEYSLAIGLQDGTIKQGKIVKLDDIRVNSSGYPKYRVNRSISPPEAKYYFFGRFRNKLYQALIQNSDVWYVTHIYENRYIIQSDAYNERQCLFEEEMTGKKRPLFSRNQCIDKYDFGIWLRKDGTIDGSWVLLTMNRASYRDRKSLLVLIDPKENDRWPDDIRFIPEL